MTWKKRCVVAVPAFGAVWFLAACDAPMAAPCPVSADAGEVMWADAARRDAGPAADAAPSAVPDAGSPAPDAGMRDAGPPPACIGSYAEGVAVFAEENFLSLPAHGDPPETAEVTAWPWRVSLGGVRPVAREVEWEITGDGALFRTEASPDRYGRRMTLAALGDVFDRGGHEEPLLQVRACVRNGCPAAAGDGSPCSCAEAVCSPVILAAGVPTLAGRWEFTGDGFDTGTVELRQDGRELSGMPFGFPLRIDGVGIGGADLGFSVEGAIGADRRSMSGLRLNEDGEVTGTWSARRADP